MIYIKSRKVALSHFVFTRNSDKIIRQTLPSTIKSFLAAPMSYTIRTSPGNFRRVGS